MDIMQRELSPQFQLPHLASNPDYCFPAGRGMYPLPPGTSPILGVEFSGTVEEAGSSDFKKGDPV